MTEYLKKDLTHLIDSDTNQCITVYVPKSQVNKYNEMSRRAFESGRAFKKALKPVSVRTVS